MDRLIRQAMTAILTKVELCPNCGSLTEGDPDLVRTFVEYDGKDLDIAFECAECGFLWYLHHQQEVWDGTFEYTDDDDGGDEGDCGTEG